MGGQRLLCAKGGRERTGRRVCEPPVTSASAMQKEVTGARQVRNYFVPARSSQGETREEGSVGSYLTLAGGGTSGAAKGRGQIEVSFHHRLDLGFLPSGHKKNMYMLR